MTPDAPDTEAVADELDVTPSTLGEFARVHPGPSAAHLAEWSDRDTDEIDTDLVAAWLVDADTAAEGGTPEALAKAADSDETDPGGPRSSTDEPRGEDAETVDEDDEDDDGGLLDRLLPDGGRYLIPSVASRVRDREDDTPGPAAELIVVETHPETAAADHTVEAVGETVADLNPEYDPGAPVADAVYVDAVEDALDGWRGVEDLRDAVAFDAIAAYSFPSERLQLAPDDDRDGLDDLLRTDPGGGA